jgi:hypothetical protein
MKKIINDRPWNPFIWIFGIVLFIIVCVGVILFRFGDNKFDWTGIYTEAIGMLLDVLFLGIILAIFEYNRSSKLEIKRYLEEIDDFRNWKSDEATYRIVGNIRRLSGLKFKNIDLSYCYLKKAELWNLKITNDATGTNFAYAKLAGAEFCNINLSFAHFEKAHLYNSKFNNSDISFANFKGANINKVDFRGCKNLDKAYFQGALFIWEAIFDEGVDIEKLKLQKKNETILGSEEPFFAKIDFVETKFQCSILEFYISEYNDKIIVMRFTKEGFLNFKNLINIVGEHQHFFWGHLKLDDLEKEMKISNI